MTSLAIYGDSFADPWWNTNGDPNQSWPIILKNNFNTVDIFAKGGSSVFYSYNKFKKTHKKYDKIIFVTTSPGRWFMPFDIQGQETHINSYATLMHCINVVQNPDFRIKAKFEALKHFYLELSDEDIDSSINDALIFHVQSIRPDCIIVPHDFFKKTGEKFISHFGPKIFKKWTNQSFVETNLMCHLPYYYNEEIAKLMLESLEKGHWTSEIVDLPVRDDFSFYFKEK